MAFVTRRADGRFEIRESRTTPRGPRARTLVTFRIVDDSVLDRAETRAHGGFDRDAIRRRAAELGAPEGGSPAQSAGRRLLTELGRGRRPSPAVARLLTRGLDAAGQERSPAPGAESLAGALGWIDATPDARGRALRELLLLVDRLPARTRGRRPRFPRIASSPR
jgi:hypothetical protein